jgi:hypothetical protein
VTRVPPVAFASSMAAWAALRELAEPSVGTRMRWNIDFSVDRVCERIFARRRKSSHPKESEIPVGPSRRETLDAPECCVATFPLVQQPMDSPRDMKNTHFIRPITALRAAVLSCLWQGMARSDVKDRSVSGRTMG